MLAGTSFLRPGAPHQWPRVAPAAAYAWLDNLAVHILAITNLKDRYLAPMIINEVDDSIVTLANPEAV